MVKPEAMHPKLDVLERVYRCYKLVTYKAVKYNEKINNEF